MQEEPKHGEERNRRTVTLNGKSVEYRTPDGQVAYQGPVVSTTFTVAERYCARCKAWIETKGILGRLFFMTEHDHPATES